MNKYFMADFDRVFPMGFVASIQLILVGFFVILEMGGLLAILHQYSNRSNISFKYHASLTERWI